MNKSILFRRSTLSSASRIFTPVSTVCRCFSTTPSAFAEPRARSQKEKAERAKAKKKRRQNPYFKLYAIERSEQYALCDAIQYLKAFEVGRDPQSSKYEAHVKLKTKRSGPVIRSNQVQLPHPVKASVRFAVVCPADSKAGREAKEAGAVLVGEDEIFETLKTGKVPFERCIAHPNSLEKMMKAGLPRVLGPKGLMPNVKNGTVTTTPKDTIKSLTGGALYRERTGVVRMAIGRLGFTAEMVRDNLKTFVTKLREEASKLPEGTVKEINEVVLSSTNGPGFSLNGQFKSEKSVPTSQLAV